MWKKWICAAGSLLLLSSVSGGSGTEFQMKTGVDADGNKYEYTDGDPFAVRIYKLKNGLSLYLSRNPSEPSVNVMTAVRAGSTDEPAASTGLAHYFEHMMFKGTSRMGALDWEKEKPLLDRLERLFEERRGTENPEKRAELYREIDRISGEAARYASPGEFSKLASSLGADGLNASTGYEFTGYVAKIPSNELGKYLKLDAERFREPVLRLFHTELETVYEEFNRCQDSDARRSFEAMLKTLFPNHPLGRSVIGLPEHLKAPSMKDIGAFYRKYYVPENMAVFITGDIDYEKTVDLVRKTFGGFPSAGGTPLRSVPGEKPRTEETEVTVSGPESEHFRIGFRLPRTRENVLMANLLSRLLCDGGYGLFDQDLVRARRLMRASVFPMTTREYAVLLFEGSPLKGQSLKDAAELVRKELSRIAAGDFEDWRIAAAAENMRVQLASLRSDNTGLLNWELVEPFVTNEPYSDLPGMPDAMEKVTRGKLAEFVSENLRNGVTVFKTTGKAETLVKVDKPPITPVAVKSGVNSPFAEEFLNLPPPERVRPETIDTERDVSRSVTPSGRPVERINRVFEDGLFAVTLSSKKGKLHDRRLEFALGYLEFLGTDRYSAEKLRQEFYKLGVKFQFSTKARETSLEIGGPAANLEKAVALLEHFLSNAKPDAEALAGCVQRTLKNRENDKLDPRSVFSRALAYAWYGPRNPLTVQLSEQELKALRPEELTGLVRDLFRASAAEFVYAGPAPMEEIVKTASLLTTVPSEPVPPRPFYPVRRGELPHVFLVDFDKVQLDACFTGASDDFNPENIAASEVLNDYFFSGLDAVVFQEIRESRALAYSAGGYYDSPMEKRYPERIYLAVGTQPDKLIEAADAARALLRDMPMHPVKFESARESVLKRMETERKFGLEVFDFEQDLERMGVKTDWRPGVYEKIRKMTPADLEAFFREKVAVREFDLVIVGRPGPELRKKLERYGKATELSLPEIYGY